MKAMDLTTMLPSLMVISGLILGPISAIASPSSLTGKIILSWGIPSETTTKESNKNLINKENNAAVFLFTQNLPEYQHEYFTGNIQRILMQLRKSQNTCFTASLEERSRLAYSYWTPYGVLPPPVLIVRKETLPFLKLKNGKVSLAELFKNKKLNGITSISRSFGPELDAFLKAQNNSKMGRASFDFYSQNLLEMIAKNRVDYTIEHSFLFIQHAEHFPNLAAVPILEAKKPLTTYVACSRSPLGRIAIEKIDHIIRQNITLPSYRALTLKMAVSTGNPAFLAEMDAYCKERAKKSIIE